VAFWLYQPVPFLHAWRKHRLLSSPPPAKAEAVKKTGTLLDKGKTNHENTKEKKHEKR
jgi:hypothetical protein